MPAGSKDTQYKQTYCTRVYMIALGTMSIIVRLTMLKYELINSSNQVSHHSTKLDKGGRRHTNNFNFNVLSLVQSA
jgi:hypothetical protein